MILKEKDTWILGFAVFIGLIGGGVISTMVEYKPDPFMRMVLIVVLYFVSVFLVVCIKAFDRLSMELRKLNE